MPIPLTESGHTRTVTVIAADVYCSARPAMGGHHATKMAPMSASALDEGSLPTLSGPRPLLHLVDAPIPPGRKHFRVTKSVAEVDFSTDQPSQV